MSIVVRAEEITYFLAGDATYDEELFMARTVEGPATDVRVSLATINKIRQLARLEPTVLLPVQDPLAVDRLTQRRPITAEP
jgi:hypothetical protein